MQSDIQITNLRLRLDPRQGQIPFEPLVEDLQLDVSPDAFLKIVKAGMGMAVGRAPVDIELASARLVDGGAEIVARVKRSILRAELRARIEIEVHDPQTIRMRIAELDAPAWVPTQFVLDHAMTLALTKPGFSRVPDDPKAVDVNPAEVIKSQGIPMKLAQPGSWSAEPTSRSFTIGYSAAT